MDSRFVVLAIGGNSLIKDKMSIALFSQYEAEKETVKHITQLIAEGLTLVITHGNGPQVGFIYRRGEIARHELPLIPLDICGADTQGAIGYMIEKALLNEFRKIGIKRKVATVVTQTIVRRGDPSYEHPTKPIGSFMSKKEALVNKSEFGWLIAEDAGRGFRRVVPAPIPIKIIELDVIKLLIRKWLHCDRCRRRRHPSYTK
jgi:carbamate kinase